MSITSEKIKQKAIELGFHKIGIAKAVETDNEKRNLEMWISQNKNGTMKWMENRQNERGNIFNYFPEAKSVISLGYNYYVGKNQNDLKGKYKFSNYSWGDDYHEVLKIKLFDLLKYPERKCCLK